LSNQSPMRFWNVQSSFGSQPNFNNANDLWVAAQEYFEWAEDHPLCLEKGFSYQGKVSIEKFSKIRAMSIGGLCLFIGISRELFEQFELQKEFRLVVQRIKDVIFEQKFAGAAAELLNPVMIARDLGLSDRKELSGRDGEPIETSVPDLSAHELALKMFALVTEGQKELARLKSDSANTEGGEILAKESNKEVPRRYKSKNEDNGSEAIYQEVTRDDESVGRDDDLDRLSE